MQPFHIFLDILGELKDEPDLQVWQQTLQNWASKQATTQPLLAQQATTQPLLAEVVYVLDARFPRRYCCLLLLCEKPVDSILERWHAALSQQMRQTMNLIQALCQAVTDSDRTTTSRDSYDKAFAVSNVAFHHSSFPYPIFSLKMGADQRSFWRATRCSPCRRAPFPNPTGFSGFRG